VTKALVVGLLLALPWSASMTIAQRGQLQVRIQAPTNGAVVEYRQEVSGILSDREGSVWLVIHPLATSEFWIQPPITVREDGSWKVIPYFGRSPSLDGGARFELRAFAKPEAALKEGKVSAWPVAAASSNVVEVVRK
jgi:hypothetical protein